jgi:hypothetical protein
MSGHTCSPGSCSCGESGSGKPSPQPRKGRLKSSARASSDDGAQELARRAWTVVERGRQLAPAAAVDTPPDLPGIADRDAPASVAELERLG